MLNSPYSRGIVGIIQVAGVQNICSSSGGVQENEKGRMKLRIGGKTSLGCSYFAF